MQTNKQLIIRELEEHIKLLDKLFADDYPLTKTGQTFIRRDIERILHMIVLLGNEE
jgi:hypothetical protein